MADPVNLAGPESCADAPLLSLAQVARGERAGERVAFDAVPRPMVSCTLLACVGTDGKQDPGACCNECGGSYGVEIPGELQLRFAGLAGCSGYDCNLRCEPFGREPTRTYRFVGTSDWSRRRENGSVFDKSTFTLEKICATEG